MKRSILLFGCLALFSVPGLVKAGPAAPVMITLDMPNQSATAPGSGVSTVAFNGTVTIAPGWLLEDINVDPAFNSSQTNSLLPMLNSSFASAIAGGGGGGASFTGLLFDIFVPAGTPADLYAFEMLSTNPSLLSVSAFESDQANGAVSIDGGFTGFFTGTAAFSVQVNGPATGVPDQGSTLLLMGASIAVLGLGRWIVRPA